ncbi:F0F1 ATP synthase subunit epsilon [uncultured Megasphaera sp.]|uniref:F0F1 ATP synthase subunit epsilon n=1 Tax=uncultured Megasphaera sp. TaxID=165188 RepID=UPI0025EB8CB3|nr:F0F1 ATP synthase subunit epsilon [uncultured Megasphaera sp.]
MAEAGKTLHLEVITPDAAVLHEDVDFVLVRALDGDLGIMPNHAPLIASLSIWPLCYDKGGKRQCVTVASGFLEVHGNTVTVITPASEKPVDIDVDRAKAAEKRAQDRLAAHAADLDVTRAEAALQRALRRLDVAEKYGKQ